MLRVIPIIVKEFKDSIRSRWLITFTIITFFLVIGLPFVVAFSLGLMSPGMETLIAGTMNVVYPLLPLIALPVGSAAIVGERDKHTLELLLSQPISRLTVFVGKFVGIFLAIAVSVTLGMTLAVFLLLETPTAGYLWLLVIAYGLAASMLGLAFLVSTASKDRAMALGISLFIWFVFAVLIDMGFLSLVFTAASEVSELTAMVAMVGTNPLELVRMLAAFALVVGGRSINPASLGTTGMALVKTFGIDGVVPFLYMTLTAWILIPLASAFVFFLKRDI